MAPGNTAHQFWCQSPAIRQSLWSAGELIGSLCRRVERYASLSFSRSRRDSRWDFCYAQFLRVRPSGSPAGHVLERHCVRSDSRVVSNFHSSENLCAGSDVYMPANDRGIWFRSSDTYCDLLRYQTVGTDHCSGENDHTVGVRQLQSSAKITVKWYVSAGHDAPETML